MALTITITNPRTIAIIEREASRLGFTETGYITHLVEASTALPEPTSPPPPLPPHESEDAIDARYQRALAILREIHPHITDEDRAFDYDSWLYDENGIPH
ncbi:MAG: hypothetical protein ACTHMX_13065 [Thermomicrobiales bacterium]